MPDIPGPALAAAAQALNEAHAKRGWNKPAPWWAAEVAASMLEAAAPLLAEAWGVTEPQAGSYQSAVQSIPCPSCGARAGEACRTAFVGHAARKRALAAARDVPEVPRHPPGSDRGARIVACPSCGAPAGEMCRTMTRHTPGTPGYEMSTSHAARRRAAEACSPPGGTRCPVTPA